jgi:hypothetical protein
VPNPNTEGRGAPLADATAAGERATTISPIRTESKDDADEICR